MTSSPEFVNQQTVEDLLLQHDQDSYGYCAQAAAAISRIYVEGEQREVYLEVARFASDVSDPKLLRGCFNQLDEVGKWEVWAYETRRCNTTLEMSEVQRLCENLVELEARPERMQNKQTLSRIYTLRDEIYADTPPTRTEPSADIAQLQEKYEHALEVSSTGPGTVRWALCLARGSELADNTALDEALISMATCRDLAASLSDTPSETERHTTQPVLDESIRQSIAAVRAMPFSSERIALSLELSEMQRDLLPSARETAKLCNKLVTDMWHVVNRVMGNNYASSEAEQPAAVRQLWEECAERGFSFYLQGTAFAKAMVQKELDGPFANMGW